MSNCLCGSKQAYTDCCERFILRKESPATPEQLMRSRYSAYVIGDIQYIADTMHGAAKEKFDFNAADTWAKNISWTDLKVIKSNRHEDKGFVEFIASYLENGKKQKFHEISQFKIIEGKWFYTDGKFKK